MVLVQSKGWLTSKTILGALLIIAVGVQSLLMEQPLLGEHTDLVITLLGFFVAWSRANAKQPLSAHPTKSDTAEVQPPSFGK